MSRRKNFPERKESRSSSRDKRYYARKETFKNQLLFIILACEGEKTEKFYFEALFAKLRAENKLSNASCIIAPHQHTNPTGVLNDLFDYKDHYTGKSYRDFTHQWIVIDRDEERTNGGGHSRQDFNNAIQHARTNIPEIKVAYSNPSFEIWFLLHFEPRVTPIDRDSVKYRLSEHLGSRYEKNDAMMFQQLESLRITAITRAGRLIDEARSRGVPEADANPSTTVFDLVELLFSAE
jgi:hypothetical protein